MIKRFFLLAAFFLLGTGTASADYVLLKVNLNQLSFTPNPQMMFPGGMPGQPGTGPAYGMAGGVGMMGGGAGFRGGSAMIGGGGAIGGGMMGGAVGMMGGGFPPPPPPGDPKTMANPYDRFYEPDPNARWLSALVEINNVNKNMQKTPFGVIVTCDTHWGKNVWLPIFSKMFPMVGASRIHSERFGIEYAVRLKKEQKDKNIESILNFARWTLSRGQLKRFREVMDEAAKIDAKHVNVVRYQCAKKSLDAPFKTKDPAQRELIDDLTKSGYKENLSKKGHYCIYAPNLGDDPHAEAAVKRRLDLLEDTLETFYYWFAVQKDMNAQPALPKHRLIAIVTGSKDDFNSRHVQWGSMPRVADGFTPQRDNVIVMTAKPCIDDPHYAELESLITVKLQDANAKLPQFGARVTLTRQNLLSGEINNMKESGKVGIFVAAAQTAVLLCKAIEDQSERHTVSNEGIRQLLVASGAFPRNVQVPDWIVEGLAAFFETPVGTAYPTIGDRSCVHLTSFKHLRAKNKEFLNPTDVLQGVISDNYFQRARQLSADLRGRRDDKEKDRQHVRAAWELARCTSWSLIYYLAQNRKLDLVFNYGKELDQLPRDMDLSNGVIQGCFARAFDMCDPRNPQTIENYKLTNMAGHWFEKMEGVNLDNPYLQAFLEKERARLDPPETDPNVSGDPNASLVGTSWKYSVSSQGIGDMIGTFFDFSANGKVTSRGTFGSGNNQGTWAQTGNTLTVTIGTAVYEGTVTGDDIQGMVSGFGASKVQWSAHRSNLNPNPMPMPNPNPMFPNPNPMFPNPNPGFNPGPRPPMPRPPMPRPMPPRRR